MAQQEKSIAFEVLKVALGGIAGLCIAVVGLRLIFGIDVIEGIAKRPPRSKADENRPVLPTVSQPSDSRTKTSADPEDAGAQQPNSEAQQAKRAPPEGQWTYGYGKIDAEEGRVVDFHVLPHFNGRGWVDSPQFPNGPLTWAGIESNSVHPSHDPNSVVIRRWTSLDVGKVTIQSFVEHIHKESDGVRAYIVSSSAGVLWKDTLLGNRDVIQLDNIDIQRGDTIDFCLDCNATVGHDHTIWFATIKMHSPARDYLGTWNSLVDFAVPSDTSGDGQSQTAKNSTPAEPMTLPASPTGKEPPPTESAPAAPVGSAESPPSRPHAVPSKEEQDRLRVEIVEVFELEKAKTVADHLALAKRLREVAADAKSKPNERFVLLRTAYDEVIAGRDFAQAFDVVEELAREYEFDREVAIRETLVKLVPEAKSQASWELVELRANELCSRFEQFEEFGASHALMQLIAPELKSCPNQELRRRLQAAADRASFIHDAWQAAKRGRAALKDAPMDPGAHLALARWRAFVLGDWEGSLDHFAAAGDEQLRKLAELEKKPPATAEEMEACAEAWLIASKSRDDLRPGVERAIYWYQSAFPVASGLLKVRIERRLAEIAGDEILGSIITKVKIGGVAVVPSAGNYVRNVLSGTVWSWSQADANQPDKSWFRLNYDGTAVAGWHGQPCFWAARENGSVWLLLAANRKTHFARFDARNASLLIDDGGKIVVCPLAPMDGNRRKEQVAGLQAAGPPRFALRHVLCATAWNWPNADPGQLDKCWFRLNRDGSAMAGWHPHPCFWAAKDDGTVLAILAGSREMSTLRFDPQQSALKAGNLVCTRILGPEVPESEHNALSKKLVATKCWTIGYGGGSRYENVTFFEDGRWHTFTTHAAGGWLAGRWQVAGDSVMVRHMPDYGFIERIEERGGNIQAVHRSSARIINEGVVLPQHDPSHRAEDHAKN